MISGKRIPEDLERWLGQSTKDRLLSELSRKKGLPVSMLTLIDGIPAIVSAEWITTGDDSSVQPLPGRPSVMVFVDKLTAKKLLAIGHDAAIKNVRISPNEVNNQTSLTISTPNGDVHILWDSENRPGADRLFPAITHSFRTADNIDDGDPYASYYAQGENS